MLARFQPLTIVASLLLIVLGALCPKSSGDAPSTAPATRPTIGLTGPVGTTGEPKRTRILRIDKPGLYENYLMDAEWAETDAIHIKADRVTLRHCEIRNGRPDGIE